MSNSTDYHPPTFDDYLAAGIMFTIGAIGLIVNLSGMSLSLRVRALRSSFGRLTAAHCTSDAAILAMFVFWAAPRTFLGFHDQNTLLSRRIGQVALYFWFVSMYSQLLIAINRFALLFLPYLYREIFARRTHILIIVYWSFCLLHYVVYFGDGCDFFYNSETYFWQFADTECGAAVSFWLDLVHGCSLCIVVLFLDTICLFNMRKSGRILGQTLSVIEKKKRSRREAKFLAQACCTGVLFTVMLFSFHVLSRYMESTWSVFATTSLMWELAHTGDGIILFAFNNELRKALHPKTLLSFSTIESHISKTKLVSAQSSVMIR